MRLWIFMSMIRNMRLFRDNFPFPGTAPNRHRHHHRRRPRRCRRLCRSSMRGNSVKRPFGAMKVWNYSDS